MVLMKQLAFDTLTVTGANNAMTFIEVRVDGIERNPETGVVTLQISGSESSPDRFSPIVEDYYIDIYVNGSLTKEERQGTARPPQNVSVEANPGDEIRVTITVNEGWNDIDPAELTVTVPEIELDASDITVTDCQLTPGGEIVTGTKSNGEGEDVWVTMSVTARNDADVPANVNMAMTIDDGGPRTSPEQFTDAKSIQPGQTANFQMEVKIVLSPEEDSRTHDLGWAITSVSPA